MAFAPRFRDLMKKYGKVAIGVHFSVSAASITGLYVAIKNNVDVASVLERAGLPGVSKDEGSASSPAPAEDPSDGVAVVLDDGVAPTAPAAEPPKKRNRTAELAASSGGALALAVLCNKALFPLVLSYIYVGEVKNRKPQKRAIIKFAHATAIPAFAIVGFSERPFPIDIFTLFKPKINSIDKMPF